MFCSITDPIKNKRVESRSCLLLTDAKATCCLFAAAPNHSAPKLWNVWTLDQLLLSAWSDGDYLQDAHLDVCLAKKVEKEIDLAIDFNFLYKLFESQSSHFENMWYSILRILDSF